MTIQSHFDRGQRTQEEKHCVTCLARLLIHVSSDELMTFLHTMRIQFTLNVDGKGKFHCRIYQHWRDPETHELLRVVEYQSGGKSPKSALVNAVTDLLMSEGEDFHAFIERGWMDDSSSSNDRGTETQSSGGADGA